MNDYETENGKTGHNESQDKYAFQRISASHWRVQWCAKGRKWNASPMSIYLIVGGNRSSVNEVAAVAHSIDAFNLLEHIIQIDT